LPINIKDDAALQKPTGFDFWKKHFIVIMGLAGFVFALVLTGLPTLRDYFPADNIGESYAALQNRASDHIPLPVVYGEKLNPESIIRLTNKARTDNGLDELAENRLLNQIAEARARDMLEKQYFAHVSPTGEQASDLAEDVGYAYKIIAENIGKGAFYSNQKIVDGWMQSPGHRDNMLSGDIREMGAAVLEGKMKGRPTCVAVQIFGLQSLPTPHNICVAPSENLLRDIEFKKAQIASLQNRLERLKDELDAQQDEIDTDKKYAYDDPQKIQNVNEKIYTYNEKSRWYNKIVGETKAMTAVLSSMIDEYNRAAQVYRACTAARP